MTDGGLVEKLRGEWRTLAVAGGVGVATILIALFVNSIVGWVVAGVVAVAIGFYLYFSLFSPQDGSADDLIQKVKALYSQSPEKSMKKLLFDDFQSSDGKYMVKEIEEEEEKPIVPSTKSAQPAPVKREQPRELDLLDFFDLDADGSLTDIEPKSEFHSLLNKVLLVLKDVLFAHTVAFFWVNREKGQMVVESMATESIHFISSKRFAVEADLVSQVASTGKHHLVGTVNPTSEAELLRYYETAPGVKSVVAVPVFYRTGNDQIQPVGVLLADSKAEDAFGQETLSLLGRFTKLVSALIRSYTDKYDLLLEAELLSSIRRMQDRIKSDPSEQTILAALADETNRLAGWDYLSVTMYSEQKKGWVLQKVVNKPGKPYAAPDLAVDLEQSIVGESIRLNKVHSVPDLASRQLHRFSAEEPGDLSGSFVSIPISSYNRCYGALALENGKVAAFPGHDVETLYRLIENAAASLEVLYMNDLAKEFVSIDQTTGSMTRKHFIKKLEEEVSRAEDFGTEMAFVSVAVDSMQEQCRRYGKEAGNVILSQVAWLVRSHLRPYDLLGLVREDALGVVLVNTPASDAYLWAESLRKKVAGHVIVVAQKSFSVTVSAGVCGLTEGMTAEQLMAGTSQVLDLAIEKGGNLVRVA